MWVCFQFFFSPSLGQAKSPGKFFLGYMTPLRGREKQAVALIRLPGKCKRQLPALGAAREEIYAYTHKTPHSRSFFFFFPSRFFRISAAIQPPSCANARFPDTAPRSRERAGGASPPRHPKLRFSLNPRRRRWRGEGGAVDGRREGVI